MLGEDLVEAAPNLGNLLVALSRPCLHDIENRPYCSELGDVGTVICNRVDRAHWT